ncbi:Ig-like domain-containing protein [Myxosarcina sp. GI1(2024)]
MLNSVNFKKISSTSVLSLLIASSLSIRPVGAGSNEPVGISSLDTTTENATSSSMNVCEGNSCSSKNFGTGNNIKLNGFTVGEQDYEIFELVDRVEFQRKDNESISGQRHIYFLEKGSDGSIASSAISTMQEAVRSDFINGGTDNVFANRENDGTPNFNNIERVDFIINSGLNVKPTYVNNAGFLLLERGGNDPFKIAAITAIDANGNPTEFGNLVSVSQETWGSSGISMETAVFQNQADWTEPKITANVPSQNLKGVFVSISALGITAEQTIYGYSVFPGDIDSDNDLVGLSDFPLNTSSQSNHGGLDLISSGGLFVPKGAQEAVFNPPAAVDDSNTTDENTLVTGNVLTNDTGSSLTVTTAGSYTLESGALLTLNEDGTYEYDPNNSFDALNDGETDSDTFNYTITNENDVVSSADVTININGISYFAD